MNQIQAEYKSVLQNLNHLPSTCVRTGSNESKRNTKIKSEREKNTVYNTYLDVGLM